MNDELRESRGVMAVITIDDAEEYLWNEEIEQLNNLIKKIDAGRMEDGKKESRSLIYGL